MKKALVNSLPKAGTNLLAKCLELFGYRERPGIGAYLVSGTDIRSRVRRAFWLSHPDSGYLIGIDSPVYMKKAPIDRMLARVQENEYLTAHVGYSGELLGHALALNFRPILVIRDPRAVLVSFVHYVSTYQPHVLHAQFASRPEVERYRIALLGLHADGGLKPLAERCAALDAWWRSEQVLKLKFEDLVGSQGGGTDARQLQGMERICAWLDIPTSRIDAVRGRLFGPGRHTFRHGQVDAWVGEISTDVRELAEEQLGDILTKWDYA